MPFRSNTLRSGTLRSGGGPTFGHGDRRRAAPRVLPVALAALAVAGGLAACGSERPRGTDHFRHVVVISLDTLRADHLGCYGNEAIRTPAIDALAEESVRFASVTAAAPTTLASHVSLFTGTWPQWHGVVRNGFYVNTANETLPELLQAAGFHTAGFVGSFALTHLTYFDQGFDHFDDRFEERIRSRDPEPNQRRAQAVTDAVLAHLDQLDDPEHLFLFVHYFDAHHPYDPPPPWDEAYPQVEADLVGDVEDQRRAVAEHHRAILGEDRGLDNVVVEGLLPELVHEADGVPRGIDRDLAARYAGEVGYLDEHLGRLLAGLRERGVLDEALVLLTADHGETFWEHGDFWNHGLALYETTMHVPLIVRLPGAESGGSVVEGAVSHTDVLPTVLELVDLPVPTAARGRSLVDALYGGAVDREPFFAEATQPAQRERTDLAWPGLCKARSVRDGKYKYVWTPYLAIEELYDLEADPGERENLLWRADPAARTTGDGLRQRLDAWSAAAEPLPSRFFDARGAPEGRLTAEDVQAMLAGLGYAGSVEPTDDGACE